jgi:hypothetical protein
VLKPRQNDAGDLRRALDIGPPCSRSGLSRQEFRASERRHEKEDVAVEKARGEDLQETHVVVGDFWTAISVSLICVSVS